MFWLAICLLLLIFLGSRRKVTTPPAAKHLPVSEAPATLSKCVQQCKLDKASQTCVACKRHINEIIETGRNHKRQC